MLCRLFLNGCARIGVLTLGVREKLDGENVWSALLDDAAEQHGPCLGGIGQALADARHEPGDDAHIGGKPDSSGTVETQPAPAQKQESRRAQPLHGNEHGGVAELQDRIAHRRRRLHQFVGHPAPRSRFERNPGSGAACAGATASAPALGKAERAPGSWSARKPQK